MADFENSKVEKQQTEFYKRLNDSAENHMNDLKKLYNGLLEHHYHLVCLKLQAEVLIQNLRANQLITENDQTESLD